MRDRSRCFPNAPAAGFDSRHYFLLQCARRRPGGGARTSCALRVCSERISGPPPPGWRGANHGASGRMRERKHATARWPAPPASLLGCGSMYRATRHANPSDGNKKTAAGGTGSRASRRRWAPARGAGARQFERLNRQVATHVAAGARQFERLTRQVATHVAAGARQFERLTRLQASRVAFLASAQSRLERPRATAQSRARSDSSSSKLRPG